MSDRSAAARCSVCDTELASDALSCPACRRLVHADGLRRLAAEAEAAVAAGDLVKALRAWREALELLPRDSRQSAIIKEKVEALSRQLDSPDAMARPAAGKAGGGGKGAAAAGVGALLLMILSKGKLLALGLTKASTLLSMLTALGVYWAAWGWKFALGLVVSIYIHEMGHVAALVSRGIKATPPMFIPGFGAVIRLKQNPVSPREDARVGLAGPLWGLGAAFGAYVVFRLTDWPSWAAIARVGGWMNLFNLLPVMGLDGARGFRSMTRGQRLIAVAMIAAAWYFTDIGLLLLLMIVGGAVALTTRGADEPDPISLSYYVFLVGALTALSWIEVPSVESAEAFAQFRAVLPGVCLRV